MNFEERFKITEAVEGRAIFSGFSKERRWADIKPGVYDDGLLTVCGESYKKFQLHSWEWLLGEKCMLMAFLAWGDFICVSFKERKFYLVISQEGGKVCLGDNLESVFDYNLAAEIFFEKILLPDKFSEVCKAVGPLKYGECFVHDPWICLGNEEEIQNYDRKNFEIYIDLLGQTLEQK